MAGTEHNDTPFVSAPCASAITQYKRVKTLSSLALAGIGDIGIGTSRDNITTAQATAGEAMKVKLWTGQGEHIGTASEAIAVGDVLYGAASGKISKTSGGGAVVVGTALEAASGDGSFFRFIAFPPP